MNQKSGGRILVGGEQMSEMVDRVSGGGDKFYPYSVEETREILGPQARSLRDSAVRLDSALRADHVVFEATLLPNFLANSYFPDRLVKLLGLTALGSRPATADLTLRSGTTPDVPTKSLIVAGDDASLSRLANILEGGELNRAERAAAEELRQFSEIRLPRREEVFRGASADVEDSGHARAVYEAVLHPDPDTPGSGRHPITARLFRKFEEYISSLGGEVAATRRDVVGGLTFVPVFLPEDLAEQAAAFNPLRSIRRMPRIRPVPSSPLRSAPRVGRPAPPAADPNAPEVLIFDAGIEDGGDYFAGSAQQVHLTSESPQYGCIEHGSAVTGAVLYGNVQPGQRLPKPSVRATHYRCIPGPPDDGTELYWLLDQIQKKVAEKDAMIVNLSLGPEVTVDDGEPHRWTAVLDSLAYERDILFVVAVGNNGDSSDDRIMVPADMVNGLSVGACDRPYPEAMWSRAPYSAVGPGRPGALIQPSVVAFGGDDQLPFARLRSDGRISFDCGTSYAAPVVSHELAVLSKELGDRASASALKAFAVHFAESHADPNINSGHGRLISDHASALWCDSNEVTAMYQASVERDQILGFQLPVPEGLQRGKVKVRWTLAYASPTDPTEAVEYTESGLEFTLRPHAAVYSFRDPEGSSRPVKVNIRDEAERAAQLEEDGWIRSKNPVSRSQKVGPKASEASRRRGGKWETVMQGQDRLQASSLWLPRLDIEYLTRTGGVLTRGAAPVDFTLLVTVTSLSGLPVYQLAQAEFKVLSALPVPITAQVRT
ncbi:S8 family peptidase [Streptomyces sp. NPDC101151]|uniref:S8 family peptidase n=1 Tax=Streptomyces sp. NPDC101151 TaxID=3366115 RepID=UPI003810C8EA